MKRALELRRQEGGTTPTTNLLKTTGTLEAFLGDLTDAFRATRPVPEIIIASHAAESGWLSIALLDGVENEVQWDALAGAGTRLNIPAEALKDPSAVLHPAVVRIRGCRIGIAPKFVDKLKQALKLAHVSKIVAPKHFQGAGTWRDLQGVIVGRTESLAYCFESYSLANVIGSFMSDTGVPRTTVVQEFSGDSHQRFDGTPVPGTQWLQWLQRASVGRTVEKGRKYIARLPYRLPPAWNITPSEANLPLLRFEVQDSHRQRPVGPWRRTWPDGLGRGPACLRQREGHESGHEATLRAVFHRSRLANLGAIPEKELRNVRFTR